MAKAKVLISFAVTAKLVCAFVFAYAECWFSEAGAQLKEGFGALFALGGGLQLVFINYLIHVSHFFTWPFSICI